MENNQLNSPKVFLHKGRGKDAHFQAQMQKVFAAFYRQPKTMLMVSVETDILRANICRYVAKWKKESRICIVRKGICPITKCGGVQYLTTNPELFPSIEPSNTVKL
jgi:NCAIR mutase (PurE)-related protein